MSVWKQITVVLSTFCCCILAAISTAFVSKAAEKYVEKIEVAIHDV